MNKYSNMAQLLELLNRPKSVILDKGSSALTCPRCEKIILNTYMKESKICYENNQILAEDGDGIQPLEETKTDEGLEHLEGELLFGYCRSCHCPYYLFDMYLSEDKIFTYDNTREWQLPEEQEMIEKSPKQMVYDVTLSGEQIGTLEEFRDMPWKEGEGAFYLFQSRLLWAEACREDDENICMEDAAIWETVKNICTKTFEKIRKITKQN